MMCNGAAALNIQIYQLGRPEDVLHRLARAPDAEVTCRMFAETGEALRSSGLTTSRRRKVETGVHLILGGRLT